MDLVSKIGSTVIFSHRCNRYMTHQLGPLDDERFVPSKIDDIVKSSVETFFSNTTLTDLKETCSALTEYVKEQVKLKGSIFRHKIIVQTFSAQDVGQSMRVASKSLWDKDTDNYSSFTFRRNDIIYTVLLFALYQE